MRSAQQDTLSRPLADHDGPSAATTLRLASATALWIGAFLIVSPVAAQTAWFTEEQAARGDTTFVIECGGCHGYDLSGVLAESSTADAFYSYISGSMPWENPGELRPQQYADIVAFFLGELGFPAGENELPPDREILAQIIPASASEAADAVEVGGAATTSMQDGEVADPNAAEETAAGWYTAGQADQGQRDFAIACGGCHGAELTEKFVTEYENAARFYSFISGAMPADDPGNLAARQYIAIIAYLLREVGFPAGDTELTNDRELLGQIIPSEAPGE